MATTPSALGRRYAPFLVVAAVQVLLVAIVPSREADRADDLTAFGGPQPGVVAGSGTGSDGLAAGESAGVTGTDGTTPGVDGSTPAGASVGTAGTGAAAGGAAGGAATASGGGGAPAGAAAADLSRCTKDGFQIGPSAYMPRCAPVWKGGDNGGETMTGVTATEVRYVYYNTRSDPQVDAILRTQGLAASPQEQCAAWAAFDRAINKRWEFYGRKAVPMDGPGANKGSARNGCSSGYKHFQSQCSLTPPDPPCVRAEAAQLAAMKPAFVISGGFVTSAFANELSKRRIIYVGGTQWQPASYHSKYFYDVFRDGNLAMDTLGEYWCKKLYNKPVRWAGADVMGLNPPIRKLGILYPSTEGDPTYRIAVESLIQATTGGKCGNANTGPVALAYNPNITTAQQQAQTLVTKLRDLGVTTVSCYCDPITPVFITTAMDQQNYHPEHLLTGTGLLDYDLLGRLYSPTQWNHAFGPSELYQFPEFSQTEAAKAWRDGGNSGNPDGTENLPFAYFTFMANAIQLAGPNLNVDTIAQGLFRAEAIGGDPAHPLIKVGARGDDFTGIEDAREAFWSATAVSSIDGRRGAYIGVDGGRRYRPGTWPSGDPKVFQ